MGDIGSLHDAQTAAALDNKQNMEQREQYYATVRKPLRSPIHEMATLEKIPGEIDRTNDDSKSRSRSRASPPFHFFEKKENERKEQKSLIESENGTLCW